MARNFRRHRAAHPIADLNITNMVDLGFTLLIIFLIATNTSSQEQTTPVNLPVVTKTPAPPKKEKDSFQVISVNSRGEFLWGVSNQPIALSELRGRLVGLAQQSKPPVIRIRADGAVPYQKVATLMAEIQKQGLAKVSFDNQAE